MRRILYSSLRSSRAYVCSARRGTSLIELLVVISIIAVLISMLLPSLKRTMELASATMCQHHLREVGHSLYTYRVENDGWLPSSAERELAERSPGASDVWFQKLFPTYLDEPVALTCPKDPFRFRMLEARFRVQDRDVVDYTSYGLNSLIANAGGGRLADLDRHHPSRPADTILVADLGPDREYTTLPAGRSNAVSHRADASEGSVQVGPRRFGGLLAWDDGFDPYSERHADTWITARHGDGINILTVGGGVRHARTVDVMRNPLRSYYRDCWGGGCSLCRRELGDWRYHYSFAKNRLYWWTGPVPSE